MSEGKTDEGVEVPVEKWVPEYPSEGPELQGVYMDDLSEEQQEEARSLRAERAAVESPAGASGADEEEGEGDGGE